MPGSGCQPGGGVKPALSGTVSATGSGVAWATTAVPVGCGAPAPAPFPIVVNVPGRCVDKPPPSAKIFEFITSINRLPVTFLVPPVPTSSTTALSRRAEGPSPPSTLIAVSVPTDVSVWALSQRLIDSWVYVRLQVVQSCPPSSYGSGPATV